MEFFFFECDKRLSFKQATVAYTNMEALREKSESDVVIQLSLKGFICAVVVAKFLSM
jgi:hypothetical protein